MTLPKLPRQLVRPEKQPSFDSEIWQPDWKCFCCHDSGIVRPKLAALVIPGYDHAYDLHPVCHRCNQGSAFDGCSEYDQRLTRGICEELDRIERDSWTKTIKAQQQHILETRVLAAGMSMRKRDRTPSEDLEAARRHEEVSNLDPKALRTEARAYLGNEYMKNGAT